MWCVFSTVAEPHLFNATPGICGGSTHQCCWSERVLTGSDFWKRPDPNLHKFLSKFLLDFFVADIFSKNCFHESKSEATEISYYGQDPDPVPDVRIRSKRLGSVGSGTLLLIPFQKNKHLTEGLMFFAFWFFLSWIVNTVPTVWMNNVHLLKKSVINCYRQCPVLVRHPDRGRSRIVLRLRLRTTVF
jgi:hypothetical protein